MKIELIAMAVIVFLWIAGGHKHSWLRDWIIPFIVGFAVYFKHPMGFQIGDLLLSSLTAGACNIIRLGYGSYDPVNDDKPSFLAGLTKDEGGWWVRGIWGLICGFICFAPALYFLGGWWVWAKAILFASQFASVCFLVTRLRWSSFWTDLAIGTSFSIILFLI